MSDLAEERRPPAVSESANRLPAHVHIAPPRGWWNLDVRELWAYRDLLLNLMTRDIKVRYKQTVLGLAWVVLQPLLSSVIFAIIFGNLAKLPSDNLPYMVFVFAGMLPWNLFSQTLVRAGNSMVLDARLIQKVYFPRMLIPIGSGMACLVDFAVSCGVMLVLCIVYGVPASWTWLAIVPMAVLAFLIAVGTSFIFSALNVYYRDFSYALPFVIQTWMYASPLVYSASLVPSRWQALFALNPMVGVIQGFRWAILGRADFPTQSLLISVAVGLGLCVAGVFVFQRVERSFADVI
jgi:lipopolysaccharide transport system permease protein